MLSSARTFASLMFIGFVAIPPLPAQGRDQPDRTIDAAERRTVIDGIIDRLKQAYVFPDTAVAMERAMRARQRRGEYDRITRAQAFSESLTAHLQAVSRDRHLRVRSALRSAHLAALHLLREHASDDERRRMLDRAIGDVVGRIP